MIRIFSIFFLICFISFCAILKKNKSIFRCDWGEKKIFTLNEHTQSYWFIQKISFFLYKGVPYVCWRTTNTIWDVFNFNFSIIILFHHFDSLFFFFFVFLRWLWIELNSNFVVNCWFSLYEFVNHFFLITFVLLFAIAQCYYFVFFS